MVALPFSSVSLISIRRCPSYVSVLIARAWIYELSVGGGVYWLACMFMVRLFIEDRSGSWAARALKSTGAKVGMVGGAMSTLAMSILSEQSSSAPHCIASYCYVSSSSLLLTLVGIMLQVRQKSAHTKDLFLLHQLFTHNNFHALLVKLCPLKHLNTALDCVLLLLLWLILWQGGVFTLQLVYGLLIMLVYTAPSYGQQVYYYYECIKAKYNTTALFQGIFKHGALFLGSCMILVLFILFYFFLFFLLCTLGTLKIHYKYFYDAQLFQNNAKNSTTLLKHTV